jgi:hypothetical protein
MVLIILNANTYFHLFSWTMTHVSYQHFRKSKSLSLLVMSRNSEKWYNWLKVVSCNCNWNLFIMKLFKLVVHISSILLLISCLLFFVIIIASLWLWLLLFLLHVKCFSFEYSQQNLIYNNNNKKDEERKERDEDMII